MNIKKLVTSLILVLAISTIAIQVAHAGFESFLPQIQETTELPTFDAPHGQAIQKAGVSNITSAFFFAMDFAKLIIGAVAIVMIIITGFKLIVARKKVDDVWTKQKEQLIYIVLGFILIMLADFLVKKVFFGVEGEVYDSTSSVQSAADAGSVQIKGIYNLIMLLAGSMAVLMMIIAGIRLVLSAGNEEVQTKVKKQLTWLIVGLFVIGIAEFVVQDFIFPAKGESIPAAEKGIQLLVGFTNFAAAFISIAAFIALLYGGYLYVIATGNEEKTGKAKKVFTGAIIALILGMGAFALVNTVIQLKPGT